MPDIVSIIKEKYSKVDFYNVYGLTENSPRVSALGPKDFFNKIGSVGKPIAHTKIKIENGELSKIDIVHLRKELSRNLPAYLVPDKIEIVDVLELTPSGKVIRK